MERQTNSSYGVSGRRPARWLLACALALATAVGPAELVASASLARVGAETALKAPGVPRGAQLGTFKGRGSKVLTIRTSRSGPLVFTTTHRGSSKFVVRFVGQGLEGFLVNHVGAYAGQIAVAEAGAGTYRIPVQASGAWTLKITRPVSGPKAKTVPATFRGIGSRVIQIRATADQRPTVFARHRGQSSFVVALIGYGGLESDTLLFDDVGSSGGEILFDAMPAGGYLLAVQADGPWTVRFER
jgi:hypothetical protein